MHPGDVALEAVGRGASQWADELSVALAMVAALNPAVVVEIGCDTGGTLWAWAQTGAQVYGITLPDNTYESGGAGRPLVPVDGATVHLGDSHDLASLTWLARQLDGRRVDALVLDGDHTAAGVREDMEMYAPLVRDGGLILLHDIAVTGDHRAEVHKVWPDLKARYLHSEIRSPSCLLGWGVIHVTGGNRP